MRAAPWLALAALCWAAPGRGAPRDSSPLLALDGQVRLRHLLAGDGRSQALLEILPSGEVRGAAQRSAYSLLEIKAVKPGVVRIRGAQTLRFLCMDGAGRPYGADSYSADACNFRERVRRDGYNLYESERLRRPLGLEPPGPGPGLGPGRPPPRLVHFLPLPGGGAPEEPPPPPPPPALDPDSADPLRLLGRPALRSPSYGL